MNMNEYLGIKLKIISTIDKFELEEQIGKFCKSNKKHVIRSIKYDTACSPYRNHYRICYIAYIEYCGEDDSEDYDEEDDDDDLIVNDNKK